MSYEVSPLPARVGDVTITISMMHGPGEPAAGARVELEGTMSHAGMTPVFAEAKEIAPGRYRTNMNLPMAGDWIVMVHLTLADGRELERQFEIKEVAPA
jgi:YtkA-like